MLKVKVSSYGMNTCPESFVPLIHCIIDYTLSLAMPDFRPTVLQFTDVMNFLSIANVSMHISRPKEDILAFTATQEYARNKIYLVNFVNNKAKWWYCVRYVIILLYLIICFSQSSVATRCRCGGKYNTDLMANLLLSTRVKEFFF